MQHHPSSTETQRGNDYLAPAARSAKILRWQPFRNSAGTVLGFFDVELPSGMVINGCKLMIGPQGRHWIATPAVKAVDKDDNPIVNRDAKPAWNSFVDFASKEARNRFQAQVLDALRRQHPEALP